MILQPSIQGGLWKEALKRLLREKLVGNNKTFFLFQKETATILGGGKQKKGNCNDTEGS